AAEADLAHARSQLALATTEAERARQLMESRAISREEFDQRSASMASAQATVQAAEAALDSAQLDLHYTEVRAPVSGRAGRAAVTRGNLASADSTLLTTLVSVDPVHVYFESTQQSANDHALPGEGRIPVRIGLPGDEGFPYRGELDFVDNRVNSDTGTLQYRAVLANPDGVFRPGQFVRVEMPLESARHAVLVDQKAVLTDQDRRYVYVVNQDNRAERRNVIAGRRVDGLLVIREGLSAGDQVVINGVQKVFYPGMEV